MVLFSLVGICWLHVCWGTAGPNKFSFVTTVILLPGIKVGGVSMLLWKRWVFDSSLTEFFGFLIFEWRDVVPCWLTMVLIDWAYSFVLSGSLGQTGPVFIIFVGVLLTSGGEPAINLEISFPLPESKIDEMSSDSSSMKIISSTKRN